jgi:hypothetical protein
MEFQRFARLVAASLAAATLLAAPAARAEGHTWQLVSRSAVGTATYNGKTLSAALPVTVLSQTGSAALFQKIHSALYQKVGDAMRSFPEYRSHVVSFNGPIQLAISHTAGYPYANVTLSGPQAGVTMDVSKSQYGITVNCRVTVSSGVMTFTNGQLDLNAGSLVGLTYTTGLPSHSESCSSSLGWIPIIGSLIENFAERKVGGMIDQALQAAFVPANLTLQPVTFAGLDQILAGRSYVIDNVNVADLIRNNLAGFFRDNTISVSFAQSPLPGAAVQANLLSISFSKQNVSFTVTEKASWKMIPNNCPPPQTACLEP